MSQLKLNQKFFFHWFIPVIPRHTKTIAFESCLIALCNLVINFDWQNLSVFRVNTIFILKRWQGTWYDLLFSLYKDQPVRRNISQWFERKASKMYKLLVTVLLFALANAQSTWRTGAPDSRCPQPNGVFVDMYPGSTCQSFIKCNNGIGCKKHKLVFD